MIFGETIITAPFAVCFLYRKDKHALVYSKIKEYLGWLLIQHRKYYMKRVQHPSKGPKKFIDMVKVIKP
ncbi:hypothetical protein AM353_00065 [Providencia stuartii]|nr:hypothetical protein AM353_00065 [Providencia stuartii]